MLGSALSEATGASNRWQRCLERGHRATAWPLQRHGAKSSVRGNRQARRHESRRGRAHSPCQGLALRAFCPRAPLEVFLIEQRPRDDGNCATLRSCAKGSGLPEGVGLCKSAVRATSDPTLAVVTGLSPACKVWRIRWACPTQ